MNDNNKNIRPEDFPEIKINWAKSKAEIWEEMQSKLSEKPERHNIPFYKSRIIYAAAAILVLLFGISSFFRFYTQTIVCPAAKHMFVNLPDGSTVQLNAESELSFKPYFWIFERKINFEGEAFFEVVKGKRFEVISLKGKTEVLGTKFNINTRNNRYEVSCMSGKVNVETIDKKQNVILTPNSKAKLDENQKLNSEQIFSTNEATAWLENKFVFTSVPIEEVFQELERQYGIVLKYSNNLKIKYTGNFIKKETPEESLNLICKPLGLVFEKTELNKYVIGTE